MGCGRCRCGDGGPCVGLREAVEGVSIGVQNKSIGKDGVMDMMYKNKLYSCIALCMTF
jgi:hypothetical protein